jgi:ubiquinone/menaquinone biosynthesis C-methylase UbiE
MAQPERWQLSGQGPEFYEQHLVPALFAPFAASLVTQASLQLGERLLDAACGTGIVARMAAPRVGEGGHVTGLDLSPGMLAVARTASTRHGAPMTWQEGSLEALPFEKGTFDVVLCQQGLQFSPNRAVAVREMRRVLRMGGRLLCSVWRDLSHNVFVQAIVQAVTQHINADAGRRMSAPCTLGNREELRLIMQTAGFGDVRIRIDILPMRIPSLEQFLPSQFAATPIANDLVALDTTRRERFFEQLTAALQPYRDDDGYTIPYETHVARAQV